ncbi:hypothetical protein VTN96DRAFT_8422 [Rasamsonia emersonii]
MDLEGATMEERRSRHPHDGALILILPTPRSQDDFHYLKYRSAGWIGATTSRFHLHPPPSTKLSPNCRCRCGDSKRNRSRITLTLFTPHQLVACG